MPGVKLFSGQGSYDDGGGERCWTGLSQAVAGSWRARLEETVPGPESSHCTAYWRGSWCG